MSDDDELRADARRNRERILIAAEQLFLERGVDVALEEIARRAKVGIATLYRRFPTREELLAATSNERFLAVAETSRLRDAEHDPNTAMRAYLKELALNTSIYQSLAASLGTVIECGTPGCNAITAEGNRLLRLAQKHGTIRPEVTFDDIITVVSAISMALEKESSPNSRVAHLVDLFLHGIAER